MTEQLTNLQSQLSSGEWNETEFKEARNALPKSAFETISTFVNTHGGYLVLGIRQDGEHFEICGVDEPDNIQNDFLSVLLADNKVNQDLDINGQCQILSGPK
jgi:ATP-dependent DNA helicase RecG